MTGMVKTLAFLFFAIPSFVLSQTSWKGTSSNNWTSSSNWTNGIPTASVDAIIGDASFTGSHQPDVNSGTSFCKSLTIGTAAKVSVLTVSNDLTVSGNITIGANGTISNTGNNLSLTGNWSNSGTYTAGAGAVTTFSGTTQTITGATTFRDVTINAGSTTTLNNAITVAGQLTVNGTFDPHDTPTYAISGAGNLRVNSGGTAFVRASTFAGNYAMTGGTSLNGTSIIDYGATTVNQTVSNALTYRTLRISGGLTKTLGGNLPGLRVNLTVNAGTLNLSTFTANHGAGSGTLSVAAGATMRIGGTNSFPTAYSPVTLNTTSTVEYSGVNQTVSNQSYGNLTLSSSAGAATKNLPGSTMTIAGNLTSAIGTGTSVSFTAAAALTVNGDVSIGSSTTFNGGSFSHTFKGNWTNNGTFTGNTSTVTLSGAAKSLSGAGANNFNNLTVTGAGITAATGTNISLAGNFSTSGSGTFSHLTGGAGTFTMSGAAKTIGGTGISFNNLTASGTISTSVSFAIAGNLSVGGSFTGNLGTVTMSGSSKTMSGAGTITFNALNVTGTLSTTNNFSIKSDLSVSGTLSATAGTATFTGTSTVSGAPNLFNVTLNGTKLQLGSGSVLGVAGALTLTSGTFDVTTTVPNTVNYNSAGAQTVTGATYNNLSLSTGGVKTAGGPLTVNGGLSINSGATFAAGAFTHSVNGNWVNNGTFTAGTSTIQFVGGSDASVTGTTTFSTMTLNKSVSSNLLALNSSITVNTLNMTSGVIHTGANSITITFTKSGNGLIIGTIIRTNAFANGITYSFEGPNNTVVFAAGAPGVTSVTVTITQGSVVDFPFGGSIAREYNVSVTGGAYTAKWRLHYEDSELNGNDETTMQQWHFNGVSWAPSGKTGNDAVNNWVEQTALASIAGRWTLSNAQNVANWVGSVSSAWENAANWSTAQGAPTLPPSALDIAQFGAVSITNQPLLSSSVTVKSLFFGSAQAASISIGGGGSLASNGDISGAWSGSATHTLDAGSQTLTVGGNVTLSDGTNGHSINLNIGSGSATITGSLVQSGNAAVSWSGGGTLSVAGDFNHTSGSFSSGSGTMVYNGAASQTVAGGISYNNLSINKSAGTATLSSAATVSGNMTLSTGGTFSVNGPLSVAGNVVVNSGTTLGGNASTMSVAGNWTRVGTFTPGTGTVVFNGAGASSIGSTTFNNLTVNKSGGTATLAGNSPVNGDLSVSSGTLDLSTFTANRTAVGGTMTLGGGTTLKVGGANNFPINYATYSLSPTSTVEYNGTVTQVVGAVSYGNLTFTNGGGNVKFLSGPTVAAGNLLINSGATFDAGSFTLDVSGNWTNNGTFIPSSSTVTLAGSSKTLSGSSSFNNLTVSGSYTASGNVTVSGSTAVTGAYQAGGTTATFSGNFSNSGTFGSTGTVTFTGAGPQTLALNAGFTSSGTVNFNGSVAPSFGDAGPPTFANVNINNTGGVTPDVGWTVGGTFVVANGATFSDGSLTNTFSGNLTNNGSVDNSGTLIFNPSGPVTLQFLGTAFTSSGTVELGGTGAITFAGGAPTFSTLLITNTNVSGLTPVSNWGVSGNLLTANGSTLNGGSGLLYTVTGDWTNNGTFNGGTSTVTLNSPTGSAIAGTGSSTFGNLTIAGIVTAASPFNVTGNLADNGTFNATGVTVSITGGSPSTIGGTTTPVPLDMLTIAKTSAVTTLAANLTGLTALTVTGGTLDLSTFTVTQNGLGGTLTLGAGTTLGIGGSNTLPTFNVYNFDPTSSVIYNGAGAQTISTASGYGSLSLSGAGTKTAGGDLTLAGDLSLSGGTFDGGLSTLHVGGNWSMTGGTFTNTGTTIEFNGLGAETVGSTGAFNNLTVNKASGSLTATTDITVDGVLTFTNGNIVTGSNKVIIGPTGSLSRVSGYVDGNLEKHISTGPTAATFEIGDATNYAPVAVSFANVSSAGDLTVNTSPGEHPNISTSAIDPALDVNRYWSITNSGTVFSTYDATFNFVTGDLDFGADPNKFEVQKFDSPTWSRPGVGARTSTSTKATGMTSFSDFAVGQLSNDTIFAGADAHGSISPSGQVLVAPGSDQSFTITPDTGYFIADVHVDTVSVGAVPNYTFTNVTGNHVIQATFAIQTFIVDGIAGAHGSISPSGPTAVNYGSDQSFTITPDTGYYIADVHVDSVSVGAVPTYTFTNVTATHVIEASFALQTFVATGVAGAHGSISPSGPVTVNYGADQTFTITPDTGYFIADVHVDSVSVGAVSNFTFTHVTANHLIEASFALQTFVVNGIADAHGTISPSGPVTVNYGADQSFTITPDTGYFIADVHVDSVSVGAVSNYTFTHVTAAHVIEASFAVQTFVVNGIADAHGSISPSGPVTVNYGADQSFTITPDTGYFIADVHVDSVSVGPVSNYTFTHVTAAHVIEASFAVQTFVVNGIADAHGTISPSGPVNVNYGANQSFTITPDTGYFIADVHVDSVSVGAVSNYTFTHVTADHLIEASFALQTFVVNATAGAHGTVSPSGAVVVTYGADTSITITPDAHYHVDSVFVDGVSVGAVANYPFSHVTGNHTLHATFKGEQDTILSIAGANGSIAPSGLVLVTYGTDQSFTITPNTGYYIADVHVDTVSVGPVSNYTFTSVAGNHLIQATFAVQTFIVNAIADANGSISPSGPVSVNYGADQSFTITADSGYFITDVHVDSVSVGAVSSYTFTHVTANHVIEASFAFHAFTIFASAGPHGTISPNGAVPADSGGSRLFTITPDSAYFIADVHVDSVSVGAVSQYTFTNIQSDHTIQAFFDTHPLPQLTSVSPATAYRGQTVNLVLVGANFINGVSTLNVGAGITVNSLTVHTSDSLLASIIVAAGVTPGSRTFTVTNSPPGGGTSGPVAFTVLNHAPSAVHLALPLNGDTVKLKAPPVAIDFAWHPSADLDGQDSLTYIVHILTPADDSIGVTTDTTVSTATLMSLLQPHTTYTWSVRVTDGFDTVAGAETFTFVTSDSVTGVVERGKGVPTEYALHQNYPNPFNPSTAIEFDLPHQSVVTLVVYNLLGQEIATLIDHRTMEIGYQVARFDASQLPSGVYLYRILADGADGKSFVQVRKMMLMR